MYRPNTVYLKTLVFLKLMLPFYKRQTIFLIKKKNLIKDKLILKFDIYNKNYVLWYGHSIKDYINTETMEDF